MKTQTNHGYHHWAYSFGGIFCVLGILSLSLGLTPFIITLREKPVVVQLPGKDTLNLKLPGTYLAVFTPQKTSANNVQRIYDLDYSLTDIEGKEFFEIIKIPPRQYASQKENDQIALFQFVVDKKGKYVLNSNYPFDLEDPKFYAVLFYLDLQHVRRELIVGLVAFLVLVGLGLYLIRKTYKAQNPVITIKTHT